jgi:hypothetical protein
MTALTQPLSISSKKYDEIAVKVRESFPNSCILWVDEIHNEELETAHRELYEIMKAKYEETCQQELFHGTTEQAAQSICEYGFKSAYNVTSAYGKGTYFAKDASYSIEFSKKSASNREIVYMLLCSVIVGNCKIGNSKSLDSDYHVTMVNNINNPSIFVSPHDAGGIPKYLIAFHKNPAM